MSEMYMAFNNSSQPPLDFPQNISQPCFPADKVQSLEPLLKILLMLFMFMGTFISLMMSEIQKKYGKISNYGFLGAIKLLQYFSSIRADQFDRLMAPLLELEFKQIINRSSMLFFKSSPFWLVEQRLYYSTKIILKTGYTFGNESKLIDFLLKQKIGDGKNHQSRVELLDYLCRLDDGSFFQEYLKNNGDTNPVKKLVKNYNLNIGRDQTLLEKLIKEIIDPDQTFIQMENRYGKIPYQIYLDQDNQDYDYNFNNGYDDMQDVHRFLVNPSDLKTRRFSTQDMTKLSTEHLEALLKMGFNPTLPLHDADPNGVRPLFCPGLSLQKVQLLLSHRQGMTIDYECSSGETALMYQIEHYMNGNQTPKEEWIKEQWKICQLLISCEADPYHVDYDGWNVFDHLENTECRNLISVEELKELIAQEVKKPNGLRGPLIGQTGPINIDF